MKEILQYQLIVRQKLKTVNSADSEARGSDQSHSSGDKTDTAASFFRFELNPQISRKTEEDTYLDEPTTGRFAEYTVVHMLKRLFIKYNTAHP